MYFVNRLFSSNHSEFGPCHSMPVPALCPRYARFQTYNILVYILYFIRSDVDDLGEISWKLNKMQKRHLVSCKSTVSQLRVHYDGNLSIAITRGVFHCVRAQGRLSVSKSVLEAAPAAEQPYIPTSFSIGSEVPNGHRLIFETPSGKLRIRFLCERRVCFIDDSRIACWSTYRSTSFSCKCGSLSPTPWNALPWTALYAFGLCTPAWYYDMCAGTFAMAGHVQQAATVLPDDKDPAYSAYLKRVKDEVADAPKLYVHIFLLCLALPMLAMLRCKGFTTFLLGLIILPNFVSVIACAKRTGAAARDSVR